jgi:hypothetical protein
MFGLLLLETGWALSAVVILAAVEMLAFMALQSRVPWGVTGSGRGTFVRQRLSLAAVFIIGIILYHYLRKVYVYDPFFHGLYTFLLAFSIFHYLTGLAAALTAATAGEEVVSDSTGLFMMSSLMLLLVALARPQVSTFGFFCGSASHLLGGFSGARLRNRRFRLLLILGLGLLFLVFLSVLTR